MAEQEMTQEQTMQEQTMQEQTMQEQTMQEQTLQEQTDARINAFFRDTFDTDVLYRDIERKDYYFLYCIRECAKEKADDGKVYLSYLAETTNVGMPEVSKTIGRLESKGYLQWETDIKIGRTYVVLTENALTLIDTEFKRMQKCYEKINAEIDADELQQMIQTMRKIREIMRQEL